MKSLIVLMAMLLPCTSARAAFYSGNELHGFCTSDQKGFVRLYAAGLIDSLQFEEKKYFCVPLAVNLGQVGDVVCKFVAGNPEVRHYPASALTIRSLRIAWPCSEK